MCITESLRCTADLGTRYKSTIFQLEKKKNKERDQWEKLVGQRRKILESPEHSGK